VEGELTLVLVLAAAVPPLGALYLVRRRGQDGRPSTYARNRDESLRRIRARIDELVG
jgi:hypothetical protein